MYFQTKASLADPNSYKNGNRRGLILSRVICGLVDVREEEANIVKMKGYDSVKVKENYIVYENRKAYPEFYVEYTI